MIQKYISAIRLKKQTVTGATGLLQITIIYLYVNMDAMVQSLRSLYIKRDDEFELSQEGISTARTGKDRARDYVKM